MRCLREELPYFRYPGTSRGWVRVRCTRIIMVQKTRMVQERIPDDRLLLAGGCTLAEIPLLWGRKMLRLI